MINLLIALVILNTIIGTATIRKATSYSLIHSVFIGILISVPIIIKSVLVFLNLIADGLLEVALHLGGSSTKEVMGEFLVKYGPKDKVDTQGDK
jgi:hypothetical protein